MRFLGLACAIALAGCNSLLSLDDSTDATRDGDHDGIADDRDNCAHVANPDQTDTDLDGFGDACDTLSCPPDAMGRPTSTNRDVDRDGVDDGCDPCPIGPNDDEDGDGVPDGCDVCPSIADPTQTDTDKDNVGDACDLDGGREQRLFFDGFTSGDHGWVGQAWKVEAGELHPTIGTGLSVANAVVTTLGWYVIVGLDLPATSVDLAGAWINLNDIDGNQYYCRISYSTAASGWVVEGQVADVMPQFTPTSSATFAGNRRLTLRASMPDDALHCEVLELPAESIVVPFRVERPLGFVVSLEDDDVAIGFTSVEVVH